MGSAVKRFVAFCFSCCLCLGCSRARHDAPGGQVDADATELQGDWIEVHALAKEQPKGKGDYYVWVFSEDSVAWRFHHTIDGKPIDAKTLGTGTFKVDAAVIPKRFDIDWGDAKKTPGIYELNGDMLKLATGGTERPTTFEDGELYVLKRQRQK